MGKRKERRIAAMMATGRRVKLDLFAELPGDSGGSTAQGELGGDIDPRHHAGSPNSPSSSGMQPENPLLLLGQYSDDELDEETSKILDQPSVEKSSVDNDDEKVKGPLGTKNEEMENNASMNLDADKDKQHDLETGSVSLDTLQNLEDKDHSEIDSPITGDLCKEVESVEETSVPGTGDVQPTADVNLSWKVVLHEESNQYYYWNTETGETSWVVPDALAQGTELAGEQKTAPGTEGETTALAGAHQPNSTLGVELDSSMTVHTVDHSKAANVTHETQKVYEPGAQIEEHNDDYKDGSLEDKIYGPDGGQTETKNISGVPNAMYHKAFSLDDDVSFQKSDDTLSGNRTARDADTDDYVCNSMVHEEDNTENDFCSSVLKHSENLLERLKSMKGHIQGHDWISKYILEVEIRLSDIKSLLCFGSSLLPFWVHCENQLKDLEVSIDTEASQFLNPVQMHEAEATHQSGESKGIVNEVDGNENIKWIVNEVDGNENEVVCSAFESSYSSANVDISKVVQKDPKTDAANSSALHTEHVSAIDYHTAHSSVVGENSGVHEAARPAELTPKDVLHSGEDVDMDVDMEVEDDTPPSATISQDSLAARCAPEEQPIQPNPPAECGPFVPQEAFSVPPPPDEDWIPPPPPDNEQVPPPPPDDLPEPSYPPPPPSETIQPFTYTEQYILSYSNPNPNPNPNFEYYSQANTEFPSNNVYGHAEGCQVAVPHPPLYYEALPTTFPGAVVVNPVESVAYYDLQDGAVLPGQTVSGIQSSGLSSESGHEAPGSDQIRSVKPHTGPGCSSLTNGEVGISTGGTEKASAEVPLTLATIQAPATTSVVDSAAVSSNTAVATVAVSSKSIATNTQTKVSRSKKRTVAVASSLRSNKKVSSLVDKWKAAKEELYEDEEDEPLNAYEILEKKRQREIETWRAQKIASGEAKDNANFQPLGGDWRERVKRKRAQLSSEAVQSPSEAPTDVNQQPDLNELSRDLPSGWQAYWDESSKQVYYGNAITSQTTWTRPEK